MNENYFGERLKELRVKFHYTMQELADLLHTSKQVISRYENGQRVPKLTTVSEYAQILDVDVTYFMPDPPHWADDVWQDFLNARSDEHRMLIISHNGLDPRVRSYFLEQRAKNAPMPPAQKSLDLTEHETELVLSYRSRPEMQPAIDAILGLTSDTTQKKQA